MPTYYRNETLFSEIYLEEITRQPEQAEVLASLNVLREYRDYADTSSLEAWTKSYIHEVLAALGFNVQVKYPGLTQLYPVGSVDRPVSLCFVTLPDESLDNSLLGRNWAERTIRALGEQGLQWGLLTNGKLWRIYRLNEPTPYETYLEIDLESILTDQAKDAYQILYKFLRAGNFTTDEDGKCQFDRFKKESKDKIDYIEKELANALRQREEGGKGVLSDLCMGYVEEIRSSSEYDLDDETGRRKIYHGAMLYMFRLLFLFYADARGLLSDENHALLAEVEADARGLHNGETGDGMLYTLWERLSAIFVDIDQTYNGGLFSPQESEFTQFIEETRVADRYLAETLFNLITYHEKDGQERQISYRDMSVRHLGTLYEGLLEHKLFITKEDTEVRVTKGKIEFIPVSRGGKLVRGQTLPAEAVYFGSDPSERKATGSYYTPEYIVDYIVRNTVGEKLKELKADFLGQEKANLEALRGALDEAEHATLANLLEENVLIFVRQKILALSVLDPAMGSGHFLVNAANLIPNFITEFLNELGIEGETPTSATYWRRWVVENCIYGVDVNPLAVELAKLSLWILSMAKNQPLSFMNHHLKCGNSLVGARLEEIGNYPFSTAKKGPLQLNMFERDPNFKAAVEDAIAKSRLITSHASTTLEDVEEKKAWLAEIEQDLQGYKAICNMHTGLYFGNIIEEKVYIDIVKNRDFSRAIMMEENNQYFNWELEFPEILLSLRQNFLAENSGFDLVVGNAPYSNIQTLDKDFRNYLEIAYKEIHRGKADIYYYFIYLANQLVKVNQSWGFILARYFLESYYADNLWNYLKNNAYVKVLFDFKEISVFDDVGVASVVIFCEKSIPTTEPTISIEALSQGNLDVFLADRLLVNPSKITSIPNVVNVARISQKSIRNVSQRVTVQNNRALASYCFIGKGATTGLDEIFVVDQKTANAHNLDGDLLVPVIEDDTLESYSCEFRQRYLIATQKGVNLGKYPNIAKYLNGFRDMLQGRYAVRNEGVAWYEIVRFNRELFEGKTEKIFCYYRSSHSKFAYDNNFGCSLTTTFVIRPKPDCNISALFLLSLLNSNYLEQTHFKKYGKGMGGVVEYSSNKLSEVPIYHIDFNTSKDIRSKELANAQKLYENRETDTLLSQVRTYLPNSTDIIHDILIYLAKKMISMNTARQEEVRRFISLLQDEIGASLDGLIGKTIIQNYLGGYQKGQQHASFEDILSVLRRNQKSLQVDVLDGTFQSRLESEYQTSLQILLPIKEHLTVTDRLIDQVVYQLYGLTDDEIATIEANYPGST